MPEQSNTFRSKTRNKGVVLIGTSVIITIMMVVLISYALYTCGKYISLPVRIIVSGVIGLTAGIIATVTSKQTIITIDDESLTYTKGNNIERFPLESFAGTYVLRQNVNGGYVGSTRYLRFRLPDDQVRRIEVPFDEQEYADIVSLINDKRKTDLITEEVMEEIRESLEGETRIDIPRDELLRVFHMGMKIRSVIGIIIVVVSVAVCILSYLFMDLISFLGVLVFFVFLGPTLAVAVSLYGRKETEAAFKATPSCVEVRPESILFDGVVTDASDVERITVTPPSYMVTGKNFEFRTVVVAGRTGSEQTYYIGKTPKGDKRMTVKEYAVLVDCLEAWCINNDIEFRQDLG